MSLEQREKNSQRNIRMVYDFTMGVLWSAVGLFLLLYRYFGFEPDYDQLTASIFGGSCLMYGAFRFWRVYKRNKEK